MDETLPDFEEKPKREEEILPFFGPGSAGRRTALTPEEVQTFIFKGATIGLSSNILSSAQYDPENARLILSFNGGAVWAYYPIDEDEALDFIQNGESDEDGDSK